MSETTFSPQLRTGVILCGTGTAGAYQAGALRALAEAGIKIDVMAAHGAGALTALAAAVDGGARVWGNDGPWTRPSLARAYRWRRGLRVAAFGLALTTLLLLSPLLVLLAAAGIYATSVAAALLSATTVSARLVAVYDQLIRSLFDPPILTAIVPRAVVFGLLTVLIVLIWAAVSAWRTDRSRRRLSGAFWWRLIGSPLETAEPSTTLVDTLWQLVRGASSAPRPDPAEIGRRYVEVLSDNFGQPGFCEVMIAVHDLDARRDLVGAVLSAPGRGLFEMKRAVTAPREAEIVDFTGPQRELLVPFLAGSLALPLATSPALVQFPAESYWRGERHRLCDRPELATRLVDELAAIGVEQVVIVSPAASPAAPHAMRSRPVDLRARMGEFVRSIETAAAHDARAAASSRFSGVFLIHPEHNPIRPFDFAGAYDEASDRQRTVAEIIEQGYADAYRRFIEPVVAAGERVEAI